MATTDFLIAEDNDELIVDGDYAVGDSTIQHIDDLMLASPGTWREYPLAGVAIGQYQSAPFNQKQTIERIIYEQLINDGFQNISIITQQDLSSNSLQFSVTGERV